MRDDMRALMAATGLVVAALSASARQAAAQNEGMVLGARRVGPTTPLKIYNPAGSLKIIGWNYDSLVIRGHVKPPNFLFAGDLRAMKMGVDPGRFGVEDPREGESAK